MVKAILAGRKTQTRRVVKGTALEWLQPEMFSPAFVALQDNKLSPYGYAGDLLWVRETWAGDDFTGFAYKASEPDALPFGEECVFNKWKPSIHMPRSASRITLEVVSVRVERLNDISEKDCCLEMGWPVEWPGPGPEPYKRDIVGAFKELWNAINAKRGYSWEKNPWVWAIEFRKI